MFRPLNFSSREVFPLLDRCSLDKVKLAIEALHKECPGSTNTVEKVQVNLAGYDSIEKAFKQLGVSQGHIDALINNTGAAFDGAFVAGNVSLRDYFTYAYNVIVAGTQVLTWTFIMLLLKLADPRNGCPPPSRTLPSIEI
ncbi:hypothetical protein HWV62_23420 [Athelia sp. TMB]|nr:hypothetical protein HWV62_23420 [Athelia sp. TMB]